MQRLLDNILKTLTATSVMSLSSTVLFGVVSALILYLGTTRILAGTMTLGTFLTYVAFLAMLVAPVSQIVSIGTQLTEGMAGLERTTDILAENPEDARSAAHRLHRNIKGEVVFDNVGLRLHRGQAGAVRRELPRAAGERDGAGGPLRRWEVDDYRA